MTTSFKGPVRSESGFQTVVKAATGNTATAVINSSGEIVADFAPVTETAEHGPGAIGTAAAPTTTRWTEAGVIVTQFKIDLTGLKSKNTAADVIGLASAVDAYIGRNVVATNGIIFKMSIACLETPATGDDDINVIAIANSGLGYDEAGGTDFGINSGDLVAGMVVENLVQSAPAAGEYFYLTAGTGNLDAVYTAGMLVVTWYGHPLLT